MKSMARLLLLFALLLGGCIPRPVVELDSARITSASKSGVSLMMRLRVNNSMPFDVRVRNVRAQVTVADRYPLPYVRFNPDQWMPANSWSYIYVPAVIPWATIAPLAAATVTSDIVGYHIAGYVDVTATRLIGFQVNDYTLDDDASVSRADLLFAAMRGTITPSPNAPHPGQLLR